MKKKDEQVLRFVDRLFIFGEQTGVMCNGWNSSWFV